MELLLRSFYKLGFHFKNCYVMYIECILKWSSRANLLFRVEAFYRRKVNIYVMNNVFLPLLYSYQKLTQRSLSIVIFFEYEIFYWLHFNPSLVSNFEIISNNLVPIKILFPPIKNWSYEKKFSNRKICFLK